MTSSSTLGTGDDGRGPGANQRPFGPHAVRFVRNTSGREPVAAGTATPLGRRGSATPADHGSIGGCRIHRGRRRTGGIRLLSPLPLSGGSRRLGGGVSRGGARAVSRRQRVDRSYAARVRADAVRASYAVGAPDRRSVLARRPGAQRDQGTVFRYASF